LPSRERSNPAGIVSAYTEAVPLVRAMGARLALDGEEVVQEACVRVLREDARLRSIRDPLGYLLQVARNLFVDRSRARSREAARRVDLALGASSRELLDPEHRLIAKQQLDIVLDAAKALPPRCREAFELHRFGGLSYAMVARRMGISPSMVEKHIAEAMLRLRRALRDAKTSYAADQERGS